ncbi:hypothetical protein GCM10022218_00690 [Sphingobacterium ginsenosidimutans]|uniref:Uncharacterized protein n=2 Tax=Sphingobacterium ginsenosidimutans TaxID=687845 RepID=A0ABP7ZPN5_9SPHI
MPELKISKTKAAVPSYVFDYETADYMPTPPGRDRILVPWASGSNRLFDDDIALDFKKSDGWNLVYNTFSPTESVSPLFFALYNKYRGLLRFYIYLPPGNPTPSTYLSDGLEVAGSFNSSLMNFSKDICNIDSIVKSMTRVQNYRLQSTGAWYACQYEVAYDPLINTANYGNAHFKWNIWSTNISNVVLNGESNGTLTGTIGTESPGGFNLGNLLGQAVQGVAYATGFKAISLLKIGTPGIKESMESGAKSGLSGAVKGFLSAILGGTPSSPQMVNLTLKTNINLTGSLSNVSGIASPTLIIPGSKIDNSAYGIAPAFNEKLGVFNLRTKPEIIVEDYFQFTFSESQFMSNTTFRNFENYMWLKPYLDSDESYLENPARFGMGGTAKVVNSFMLLHPDDLFQFNSDLVNQGTKFKVLRYDIMIPYEDTAPYKLAPEQPTITEPILDLRMVYSNPPATESQDYKGLEKIGNQKYIVFGQFHPNMFPSVISYIKLYPGKYVNNIRRKEVFMRYTVLVTPPNGGKPVTIVKSFKVNVKRRLLPGLEIGDYTPDIR